MNLLPCLFFTWKICRLFPSSIVLLLFGFILLRVLNHVQLSDLISNLKKVIGCIMMSDISPLEFSSLKRSCTPHWPSSCPRGGWLCTSRFTKWGCGVTTSGLPVLRILLLLLLQGKHRQIWTIRFASISTNLSRSPSHWILVREPFPFKETKLLSPVSVSQSEDTSHGVMGPHNKKSEQEASTQSLDKVSRVLTITCGALIVLLALFLPFLRPVSDHGKYPPGSAVRDVFVYITWRSTDIAFLSHDILTFIGPETSCTKSRSSTKEPSAQKGKNFHIDTNSIFIVKKFKLLIWVWFICSIGLRAAAWSESVEACAVRAGVQTS